MHKKTAPLFVHYGEPEKIKKSFAFNVDIFTRREKQKKNWQERMCVLFFLSVWKHTISKQSIRSHLTAQARKRQQFKIA